VIAVENLDEILEALDLSRAQPGSGFLEALFLRFNDRVPFENASKIVRDAEVADPAAKPRTPDVFWPDHLAKGTGGTCFARVAAFDALLTELGFRTRRVVGGVREPGDHAALFVETSAGEILADVGFPLPGLVSPEPGRVETALASLRIERDAEQLRVTYDGGVPEGPRSLFLGTETVSPEKYRELWERTFRNGAPFLRELTMRRDRGDRVLSYAGGEVRVDDRHSRLRIPLPAPRASALARLFEMEENVLARAFAISGESPKTAATPILTSYLDTDGSAEEAYAAIASPEGYRRLLQGVAEVGNLTPTPSGFRLTLSPGPGSDATLSEDVTLDAAAQRVTILRKSATAEHRSSYRAQGREGRTYLMREAALPGTGEELLRNDSLRGRLAAGLAVDLLAWSRLLSQKRP
jgi:hypothetical protein